MLTVHILDGQVTGLTLESGLELVGGTDFQISVENTPVVGTSSTATTSVESIPAEETTEVVEPTTTEEATVESSVNTEDTQTA